MKKVYILSIVFLLATFYFLYVVLEDKIIKQEKILVEAKIKYEQEYSSCFNECVKSVSEINKKLQLKNTENMKKRVCVKLCESR